MKRFLICLALLIPVFPAIAQNYLPRDIQRFMARRETCDQIRREVSDGREKLFKLCMDGDKEFAQLKRKYVLNSTIMQVLNQFEVSTWDSEVQRTLANQVPHIQK